MLLHASVEVSPSERRGSARRTVRLQSIAASHETAAKWNVQIHDLSTTGFLMEADASFVLGEGINLQVAETIADAQVVWTSGRFVGCRFISNLSKSQLSAAFLKSEPNNQSKTNLEDRLRDTRERVAQAARDIEAIGRELTVVATTQDAASQAAVDVAKDSERSLAQNEEKRFPLYIRGWFIFVISIILWALVLAGLRLL